MKNSEPHILPTGLFVLFEGIDGSGKSTASRAVEQALTEKGIPAELLFEPTAGETGKRIRTILKSENNPDKELLKELFITDRDFDVTHYIRPALFQQKTVLLDRYYYSNAAYQAESVEEAKAILQANRNRKFPEPDLIFYFEISPDEALRRISGRSETPQECFDKKETLEKIDTIYRSILPEKTVFIDAIDIVETNIQKIISEILNVL